MLKKIMLVAVVLTLSSFVLAQGNKGGGAAPATTACAYNFSSGSGVNFTSYCVTANGNIPSFANPSGNDHVAPTWPSEGYAFCDFTPATPVAYYDYATNDSGNWLAPTVLINNATTVKLARTTSDGLWVLTQTFVKVAATAANPGGVKVTMALKNNTGIARTAYLFRYVDIDANGDYTSDDQLSSYRQYTGQDAFSYGMSLASNASPNLVEAIILSSSGIGPDPCNAFTSYIPAGTFHGDGSGFLWYYLPSVPKLGTKTVTMTYKAF